MVAKFASLVVIALIYLLQIPIVMMYLQAYLCDEDPDAVYVLDISCSDPLHIVMVAIATVCLPLYLAFLFFESALLSTRAFESDQPWSSLDLGLLRNLRFFIKILLCCGFIFDKFASAQGYIQVLSAALYGGNLYLRMTRA